MQFFTLIISALAATAFAYPTNEYPAHGGGDGGHGGDGGNGGGDGGNNGGGSGGGSFVACANNGAFKTPQCCATDVLGVADLDCANPTAIPSSASNFQQLCANVGQRPRCCILPILGQGLLCQTPLGATKN